MLRKSPHLLGENMHTIDDGLKSELNSKGFRATPQRQRILGIFQNLPQGEHLAAEQVHTLSANSGKPISVSTVYRTLHLMVSIGLLRELELAEGHKYYELNQASEGQHHHLVCIECGQTIEFSEQLIDQISQHHAKSSGYHMVDCQLTLYGICKHCMS
ncbi:MAG: Fur family transcriptional regulator [Cyanobacteria bacterium J06554_11]